jgi:molecular chaperone DnaK (HSP70)
VHRNPREHSCDRLSPEEIEPATIEEDFETELDSIVEEKASIVEKVEDVKVVELKTQEKPVSIFELVSTSIKKIDKNLFIIFCVGILIGLSVASFMDSLSKDYKIEYEALKENYKIIQEKYGKVLNNITTITGMYDVLNDEKNSIEKELITIKELLDEKTDDYNILLNEYDKLTQEYSILNEKLDNLEKLLNLEIENPINPSINEIETWLTQDETDKENMSDSRTALTLSLNGLLKNWKIGVLEIQGANSTDEDFTMIINSVRTELGIIYINSKTDEIWWYPNYIEINKGDNWKLGNYENFSIKKITKLL